MTECALWLVLAIAAVTDLKQRMIYNWLTLPAMAVGLFLGWFYYGTAGLTAAGMGLLAGGIIFLPPFFFGAMGGGDVKLLAAVGALAGVLFVLKTAVYACLLGGVYALALMIVRGRLKEGLRNLGGYVKGVFTRAKAGPLPEDAGLPTIPFGACVAAGALWVRFWDVLPTMLHA